MKHDETMYYICSNDTGMQVLPFDLHRKTYSSALVGPKNLFSLRLVKIKVPFLVY